MMGTKFNHCSIIDNDCATGKTFHVLSLCALWLRKKSYKGIVYACRTIDLMHEIYQRAIAHHGLSKDDIVLVYGTGAAGILQKEMKQCHNKLIITTHDAIIHLTYTSKKDFVLIHDEKPSDNNIISVFENLEKLFEKSPELKEHIRTIIPDSEYRNKRFFSNISEKYYKIALKSRWKSLKLLSKLIKNNENEQFFDVIFFLKDLLLSSTEYYLEKSNYPHLFNNSGGKVKLVKLINYNPYNGWAHVFFVFSHSTLDNAHELSFMRKLKLFNIDYDYYNRWSGKDIKFNYQFDNIELHTANTLKNWSKTYYSKNNRFDKALDMISNHLSPNDNILVLCNKGYEDKVLSRIPNAVMLDHAPYGKEKAEYLKCNVIIDLSAKYHTIQNQKMLSDFGFDANVLLWDKTDDIIQYLMRSKARFDKHENIKLFVLNSKTADLLSSVLGIIPEYDIMVDDSVCKIVTTENDTEPVNPCYDKKYYITVYKNTRQAQGELFCFNGYDDILEQIPMDHHKNSGCYLLGKSVDGGRKKSDIECLSFLVFDFDNQSKRLQTESSVVKQIQNIFSKDVVFFIQKTFNPGNYRVLIPLSDNISARQYEQCMSFFVAKLKNIDESCKRATQVYFSPKHEFKKYGTMILDIKKTLGAIPSTIGKNVKVVKNQGDAKNVEMAMLLINAVPKKVRKSNEYCVKLVSGMKKLIGCNNIENAEIWGLLFEKMRVLLQHEGLTRINDFVKMSYR